MTADQSYVCDLCGHQSDDLDEVKSHLKDEHGVADPVEVGRIDQADGKVFLQSGDEVTIIDLAQWIKDTLGD